MLRITQSCIRCKATAKGDVKLTKVSPTTKRDHVPVETGAQGGVGSPEWCETYIPWSEGLTFNMVTWQRHCDVTNDGVYDMCDYYEPNWHIVV